MESAQSYTPVTTLRQRGPVDAAESIDAPEGLSVDFDMVISSGEPGRTTYSRRA